LNVKYQTFARHENRIANIKKKKLFSYDLLGVSSFFMDFFNLSFVGHYRTLEVRPTGMSFSRLEKA